MDWTVAPGKQHVRALKKRIFLVMELAMISVVGGKRGRGDTVGFGQRCPVEFLRTASLSSLRRAVLRWLGSGCPLAVSRSLAAGSSLGEVSDDGSSSRFRRAGLRLFASSWSLVVSRGLAVISLCTGAGGVEGGLRSEETGFSTTSFAVVVLPVGGGGVRLEMASGGAGGASWWSGLRPCRTISVHDR